MSWRHCTMCPTASSVACGVASRLSVSTPTYCRNAMNRDAKESDSADKCFVCSEFPICTASSRRQEEDMRIRGLVGTDEGCCQLSVITRRISTCQLEDRRFHERYLRGTWPCICRGRFHERTDRCRAELCLRDLLCHIVLPPEEISKPLKCSLAPFPPPRSCSSDATRTPARSRLSWSP